MLGLCSGQKSGCKHSSTPQYNCSINTEADMFHFPLILHNKTPLLLYIIKLQNPEKQGFHQQRHNATPEIHWKQTGWNSEIQQISECRKTGETKLKMSFPSGHRCSLATQARLRKRRVWSPVGSQAGVLWSYSTEGPIPGMASLSWNTALSKHIAVAK